MPGSSLRQAAESTPPATIGISMLLPVGMVMLLPVTRLSVMVMLSVTRLTPFSQRR